MYLGLCRCLMVGLAAYLDRMERRIVRWKKIAVETWRLTSLSRRTAAHVARLIVCTYVIAYTAPVRPPMLLQETGFAAGQTAGAAGE